MRYKVLVTGASGSIGSATVEAILKTGNFDVRLLLRDKPLNRALAAKWETVSGGKIEVVWGDVLKTADCNEAVTDVNIVLHFAGVVPPKSCHDPDTAEKANYFGTKNLIDAIKSSGNADKIRFVYAGSMAAYGNRDYNHPWARVGDPVMPSSFDCYAISKIRAERYVVESGLKYWLALRIAGVLYESIIKDTVFDGLMFYTPLNAPVEMTTDKEMAVMFRNLVQFDSDGTLDKDFWRKIYNAGGGDDSRFTGYELYEKGMSMIKSHVEKLIEPQWLPVRNGFTCWYADGDELNNVLKFRSDSADDFFKRAGLLHSYYKLTKPLGPFVKKFLENKIIDMTNAPIYWVNNGMSDRVNAFFGGYDEWGKIPRRWRDYPLLCNGKVADINGQVTEIDYDKLRDESNKEKYYLDHGFNDKKRDSALDFDDFNKAAAFRGGKCLSSGARAGDMHTILLWQCANGHTFKATAYGVLRAGYWCNECCTPAPWNFDEISKKVPYYAQVWYDTHRRDESIRLTAECYHDIPREDERDRGLPADKIKKYRKG